MDAYPFPLGRLRAARILLIQADVELRRTLQGCLQAHGYQVELSDPDEDGLAAAGSHGVELVLLDVPLCDAAARAFLRELRARTPVPLIVLSTPVDEADKVAAFDAGADDCITRPFGVRELMARIRAQLRARRRVEPAPSVVDDGHLRIDLAQRTVTLGGQPVSLTRKEFALLALLVRHAGRVVSQPYLLRELWGPTYEQDTHYLRILVAKLRNKLGDDAAAPRWIATEPGVGLRFLLPG